MFTTLSVPLLFGIFAVIFIAAIIYHTISERKRQTALQQLAASLNFRFSAHEDRGIAKRFHFLEHFGMGSNRYAQHIFTGESGGEAVSFFEYHYQTSSSDSDGNSKTQHHYFSVFTLSMPRSFPELVIKPEGFFAKLTQAFGFDDIDFESLEFSKRYQVESRDKKFAYDFCNARMIDYLLNKQNLVVEVEHRTLALTYRGKFSTHTVRGHLRQLQQIRSLIPSHLFT